MALKQNKLSKQITLFFNLFLSLPEIIEKINERLSCYLTHSLPFPSINFVMRGIRKFAPFDYSNPDLFSNFIFNLLPQVISF